jgi:hypothetical protein
VYLDRIGLVLETLRSVESTQHSTARRLAVEAGTLMEGAASQIALPILGIVAAAAVTFYTVSFNELRDVRLLFFPFFSLAFA